MTKYHYHKPGRISKNGKLKNSSIALPKLYVENLEALTTLGKISSRSEGVRLALEQFLNNETQLINHLSVDFENMLNAKLGLKSL